jgi:hypothetical protein
MHFSLHHISVFLIIIYLCIPVIGFAHVDIPNTEKINVQSVGEVAGSPCEHCPCSDEQGSGCCDADFCSCGFHTPPVPGVQLCYAPVVIISRHVEHFWKLPQVYFSIFVPPQNQPPERFPVAVKNNYTMDLFVFA